jgi:hypothetical protein
MVCRFPGRESIRWLLQLDAASARDGSQRYTLHAMPALLRNLLASVVVAVLGNSTVLAQPRPSWDGIWIAAGRQTPLDRLDIREGAINIGWNGARVACRETSQTRNLPPTLRSATFECPTRDGPAFLAVTGTPESLLLVHAVLPGMPGIQTLVFTPPAAGAERPPSPRPDARLPQFPMPPPEWTLRTVLPAGLAISREGEPLGDIFDRLRQAMGRAQIQDYTVYGIENDGFAVVARMESIGDDGRPATERWVQGVVRPAVFSIGDYLKALFTARPGRYRVIAFLVTARTVTPGAPTDKDTLNRLWRGGAGDLPDDVRRMALPPSGRCEALVYEFFRATDDDPPRYVADSRLTGPQHLAGAGLWPIERLVP